jgi:hypothetical protein
LLYQEHQEYSQKTYLFNNCLQVMPLWIWVWNLRCTVLVPFVATGVFCQLQLFSLDTVYLPKLLFQIYSLLLQQKAGHVKAT